MGCSIEGQILKNGQKVNTESGLSCEVEEFIGGGGQGEVYKAKIGRNSVALKWYFPEMATAPQRTNLETLIEKGPPDDRYLWPQEIVVNSDIKGYGYIMRLRPPEYKNIVDLMKRRIDPSFRALATAGYYLARSFFQLHAKGLCYRDISFNNVFFDPKTGSILICDNDNVVVDGEVGGIRGTPRFMAPEVVRNEAPPSTQTDLFSLAILLFYLFVIHHPLEGKQESSIHAMDLPAMTRIYGENPVFIFDPKNESNRPVLGYHDNALAFWPIYPNFFKDLFTRTFTDGIRDPLHGRVRESEWYSGMIRLRDSILYCSNCGAENFYDVDYLKKSGGKPSLCWNCNKEFKLPPRMRIDNDIIMLNYNTKLYPHHIDDNSLFDFLKPIAEVTQHPKDPKIWGLKNLSGEKWITTLKDGTQNEVNPGQSFRIAVGAVVNFGTKEGEIRT